MSYIPVALSTVLVAVLEKLPAFISFSSRGSKNHCVRPHNVQKSKCALTRRAAS